MTGTNDESFGIVFMPSFETRDKTEDALFKPSEGFDEKRLFLFVTVAGAMLLNTVSIA